jgi:hypothetical protein
MRTLTIIGVAIFATLSSVVLAADMTAEQSATAKWMISQATAWSDQACGGKWVISELFADDFRGTAPKGSRYQKPTGEPTYDANTKWSTECHLDEADVRFFGEDVAVVYGAESKTVALADARTERRCLVWTDTWLKRGGKWQIIAAQDNRVECPSK